MPDKFDGTDAHYETLRKWLKSLTTVRIGSKRLLEECPTAPITRTALDKFRRGLSAHCNERAASTLFDYIQTTYPGLVDTKIDLSTTPSSDDLIAVYLNALFDVKTHRASDFYAKFGGPYLCYAPSEIFHEEDRIVRSHLLIEESQTSALKISEAQSYDGRFGGGEMSESFSGFCVPKSGNILFITAHEKAKTPKIFYINDYMMSSYENKVDYFRGFIVKFSRVFNKYYQCNFYCTRSSTQDRTQANIIEYDDLKDDFVRNWIFPGKRNEAEKTKQA